jgi:integrase
MDLADQRISSTDFSPEKTVNHISLSRCKNVTSHGSSKITTVEKCLNTFPLYNSNRRVCAEEDEAKNLAKVKPQTEKRAAGATKPDSATVKGKLLEFAWWMKKQGYAKTTIITRVKLLKILVKRGANIFDSESVKEAIANQKWCNKRKVNAADAYTCFLRMHDWTWEPPRYKVARKLPFVPTEKEIDQLIAGCSRKFVPLLQLLKETGVRIGEASQLKWTDIDLENGTIRVTPEKGSNPRMFQVSNKLRAMLTELQRTATSEKVFARSVRNQRRIFQRQRKKVAAKLHNPRIEKITFHTFRHFKATMEYHKTKDILHVMRILGHRNINNTLIYTQLVDFKDEEYTVKVAHNIEEDKELVEAGFEYVTDRDNFKIYRKRK